MDSSRISSSNDANEHRPNKVEQHSPDAPSSSHLQEPRAHHSMSPSKWPEIEPRDASIPLLTKIGDKIHSQQKEHRPERVKNLINEFTNTIEIMKNKIKEYKEQDSCIIHILNNKMIRMIKSIINDFNISSKQAMKDYGNVLHKGKDARNHGEESMKNLYKVALDLNDYMNKDMSKDIDKWHQIRQSQIEIREALKSVPEKYRSLVKNLALRKLAMARAAYGQILEGYQRGIDRSDARKRFDKAYDWFKARPNDLIKAVRQKTPLPEGISNIPGADDSLIEMWKEHAQWHEYIYACLGDKAVHLEKKMIDHINLIDKFKEDLFTYLDNKNIKDAKYFICNFKFKKREPFESYLKQEGLLANTEQIKSKTGREISGAATLGKKEPNEDAYFVNETRRFFAVFDGLGGEGNADIASSTAKYSIADKLYKLTDNMSLETCKETVDALLRSIHKKVKTKQEEVGNYRMGTTVSAVYIMKDGTAVIGNIGDSRVYLLKSGSLSVEQLTLDDNGVYCKYNLDERYIIQKEVADLETYENLHDEIINDFIHSKDRQVVVQSLGSKTIEPHIYTKKLEPGDMLLLTSDGVHDNLTDSHIADCLLENKSHPQEAANALIQAAKQITEQYSEEKYQKGIPQRSKPDDITAIVVKYSG